MENTISVDTVIMPRAKGEITIPIELRKKYNITPKTPIGITDFGGRIILVPIRPVPIKKEDIRNKKWWSRTEKVLKETWGAWGKSEETGEEYVERIRRNIREREYAVDLRSWRT